MCKSNLLFALLVCWAVNAAPTKTVDGDTFDAVMTIWPGLIAQERIRVLDVDTWEKFGATKAKGEAATKFTDAWLSKGNVMLRTCGRDAFGRLLAEVTRDGESLADLLKKAEHQKVK